MRLLILALALTLSAISARAQEPLTLRFAGDLTDLGDQPIRGPVDLHFSLYDTAEGGVALWTETHAGYTPSGGAVSVALGSIQALPRDLDTDQRLFLGVRVGDDVEIAPRMPLGGSLRALTADRADQAERAVRADVALTADDAADVLGREIHPASVSIGDQEVIDAEGRWVGPPVELPADLVAVELSADPVFRSLLAADLEAGYGDELRGPQGIGVEAMTVNSLGELVVTLTNGVRLNLGRIVGETGLQGDVGPQGQRGAPGDQGAPGPEGPAGPRGFTGDQGARGPEGPRGVGVSAAALNERGELVLTWTDASTEIVGNVMGPQGPQGEPGAPGLQGAQGDPGEPGAPGEAGPQGAQGPPGAQGVGFTAANLNAQGELILQRSDALEVNVGLVVGAQGPQGAQGPRGPAGERGVGVSSAELNAEGELVITTTDQASLVVGSVIGATGAQGPAGQRGERGERGEQGLPGNDGGVGPQGPQGLRGLQGLQGPQGDPGPAGPMGPAGNGIDFTQDSDDDGFPDWIESALLTDPLLADSKPADDNANGIADLFESSAAGGGNTFYVPPGDALNVSWKLTNESLGDASNPESLLLQKLEAIRGIRVIRGDLVIGSDDLAFVELPNLEEVQGSLILDADTEVRLPALRVVGQDVIYRQTRNLSSTALPALEQVGGDLTAYPGTSAPQYEYTNPVVDELPALVRVEGMLSTGIVAYPRLSYAGSMTYKYRGTLENAPFTFPALEVVSGQLTVGEYTTMLPSMPLLREVELLYCIRPYITTLKLFPSLTDGAIYIDGNGGGTNNGLRSIEGFPALERSSQNSHIRYQYNLTSIGSIGIRGQRIQSGLYFSNNNRLPSCVISEYRNRFIAGGSTNNSSQAADCTCTTQQTGEVTCQ